MVGLQLQADNMVFYKMPGIFKDCMSRRGGNVNAEATWNWLLKHRGGTAKSILAYKDEDKLSKLLERQVGDFRSANNGVASGAVKPNAAQRPRQAPTARSTNTRATARIAQPEAFRLPNGINAQSYPLTTTHKTLVVLSWSLHMNTQLQK